MHYTITLILQQIKIPYKMFSTRSANLRTQRTKTHRRTTTSNANLSKIGNLNHVAIAVPKIEKAVEFYTQALGAEVTAPHDLPDHGVKTVFVKLPNTNIELLEPLGMLVMLSYIWLVVLFRLLKMV